MAKIITIAFALFLTLNLYPQQLTVTVNNPPVPFMENGYDWGTDQLVFANIPSGRSTCVYKLSNTTIYAAVTDTSTASGRLITFLSSTNNGTTWTSIASIAGPAGCAVTKTEMIRSGLDSIYCTFLIGRGSLASQIYIFNVGNNGLRPFLNGNYRDFGSWASSTGGYYLFVDSLYSANIPRYASTDGGVTWTQRGLVTSAGANPYTVKSGNGDTAILLYYLTTAGLTDTTTAGITHARYRESGAGLLTSIAFLQPLVPAGQQKDQYGACLINGTAWVYYTQGAPGSRDIYCYISTNGGIAYGSPTPVATSPSVDEYWFDTKHYLVGYSGTDLCYYYDSTGGPSNTTDKIMYSFAAVAANTTFSAPVAISEHFPNYSDRGYIPNLFEFYNTGDLGVIWVGNDAGAYKLYFDRYNAVVGLHNNGTQIPGTYSLSQNYPNPFNPATKINFAVPVSGNVSIKLYDILGREAAEILNKEMNAGSYTIDFDASKLSSGAYFYRMESGNFVKTMKMVLVK